ncbi:hypothetical protein Bbelb_187040 [Branchiostoma belcheri]|nr:hypothetical protein Bbelb_187040 [Branchiostoma belcheri]
MACYVDHTVINQNPCINQKCSYCLPHPQLPVKRITRIPKKFVLVATDFSKAFELIPWICNFISNRKQCVRYHGSLSTWEYLSCGVAQGTLLGPILFLTLIDDAASNTYIPTWKYVDDMNLLESRTLHQPSTIQQELDDLHEWSTSNHMLLNGSKCLTMHVTFSRNPPPLPPLQILILNLDLHGNTRCVDVQQETTVADLTIQLEAEKILPPGGSMMAGSKKLQKEAALVELDGDGI